MIERKGWWTLGLALALLGCSTRMGLPEAEARLERATDAGADAESSLVVDEVRPPLGVADRGRDPALVLLRGPAGDCSATFVAKDVLLTARACVDANDPGSLTVHVGDEPADEPESARGLEVLIEAENEGDDDIAFVVIDAVFTTQKPLGIRVNGIAAGNRVRAVGHSSGTDWMAYGARVLREHVRVRGEAGGAFYLSEGSCSYLSGGPALDPSNGQIVGVLTGPGDTCEGEGASMRYVRIERYADLYDRALGRSGLAVALADLDGAPPEEARPRGASRPGTQKPPSEVGGICAAGTDCATGVCILHEDRAYCSRACGRGDRCPTNYRCEDAPGASSTVCVLAP